MLNTSFYRNANYEFVFEDISELLDSLLEEDTQAQAVYDAFDKLNIELKEDTNRGRDAHIDIDALYDIQSSLDDLTPSKQVNRLSLQISNVIDAVESDSDDFLNLTDAERDSARRKVYKELSALVEDIQPKRDSGRLATSGQLTIELLIKSGERRDLCHQFLKELKEEKDQAIDPTDFEADNKNYDISDRFSKWLSDREQNKITAMRDERFDRQMQQMASKTQEIRDRLERSKALRAKNKGLDQELGDERQSLNTELRDVRKASEEKKEERIDTLKKIGNKISRSLKQYHRQKARNSWETPAGRKQLQQFKAKVAWLSAKALNKKRPTKKDYALANNQAAKLLKINRNTKKAVAVMTRTYWDSLEELAKRTKLLSVAPTKKEMMNKGVKKPEFGIIKDDETFYSPKGKKISEPVQETEKRVKAELIQEYGKDDWKEPENAKGELQPDSERHNDLVQKTHDTMKKRLEPKKDDQGHTKDVDDDRER